MLTYGDLREIQKKELGSAAIVHLEKDFYEQLKDLLVKKKKEALESSSLLVMREYENLKRIALSITSKREEKLLLMAIRAENSIVVGLSESETALLTQVTNLVAKQRALFKELVGEDEVSDSRRVRILKDIERYVGLNKGIYGPYKSGEEHLLNKDEADWLVKARIAEIVR